MYAVNLTSSLTTEAIVKKAHSAIKRYVQENGTTQDAVLVFSVKQVRDEKKNEAILQRKD